MEQPGRAGGRCRRRLVLSYGGQADGISPDQVIQQAIQHAAPSDPVGG